ncbi:hypothetical protein VX159_07960 [Dechloromonas sp. ZY10]|uniref:hypothetical protein n=1 Tax=Dechloromonas aquae TaxID=2664436 RepID=UPI0035298298
MVTRTVLFRRLWLAGALLLAAWPLLAADPCGELPKPSVDLQRLDEAVKQDDRYSYRTLTSLAGERTRPNQTVLGLTRGKVVARIALRAPRLVDPSGRWECLSPQLQVSFGYAPLTVHVASEFPPGSCAYQEILAHEQKHVEAYRQHAVAIEQELAATFAARFTADPQPWRGAAGQVGERLQKELDERWLPFIQRRLAAVEVAQAAVDAPEEYERVSQSCDGEIRKRLQAPAARGGARPARP